MASSASPATPLSGLGILKRYNVTEGDLQAARDHLVCHAVRHVDLCSAGFSGPRGLTLTRTRCRPDSKRHTRPLL